MRNLSTTCLLRGLVLAAVSGLIPCLGHADQALSYAIGVAVSQTSNVVLLGQEQVSGAQAAEKWFNDRGGIGGVPLKVIVQDAGGDEVTAVNAVHALLKNPIFAIIGPTLSQQAFSIGPILNRMKIPLIGPSNTAQGIPEIGEFVSRVSAPAQVFVPAAVTFVKKKNPKIKLAMVLYAQNDAFSSSETQFFQSSLKQQGVSVVGVQKFQTTDNDFTTQVSAVLQASVDVVAISGLAADGGNLVKQLRQRGYKGLILGGNGFNTPHVFNVCQKFCDGLLVAQAYSPAVAGPQNINKEFIAAFEKQFQKKPGQLSAQLFTGIQVVAEALKKLAANGVLKKGTLAEQRIALNKEILSGHYATPLGDISFLPSGEIQQKEIFVAEVKMKNENTGSFEYLKQ